MQLDKTIKKVSFNTLGCRLNFSESGSIAQGFATRGYEIVDFDTPADVVFLNTCTVTDGADSSCRNLIRKAQKNSPEAKIVVAGCYAQMEAEKIKEMSGVDLILGTSEKYKVFEYLDSEQEQIVALDKSHDFFGAATTPADDDHTRAFLKIQDGCNYVCSFCIIPFARGRSRAITVLEAKNNAMDLIDQGYKEIVLTGVNIGEYEAVSGEKLVDLVKEIVDIDGVKRLRLSSVEPNTMTEELVATLKASGKYQDHFHIPLQSGDNEILKSMRRKYTVEDYKRIISMIRKSFPNASFGADVICGYPGESEEQFLNTYNLMRDLPLTHFHVFPYSKRKGTTASKMEGHIQSEEKKRRVKSLMALGEMKLENFMLSQVGKTTEVLFERRQGEYFLGHTSNFLKIKVKTEQELKNQIYSIKITGMHQKYLTGEFLQ